jgi:hypothetical protein
VGGARPHRARAAPISARRAFGATRTKPSSAPRSKPASRKRARRPSGLRRPSSNRCSTTSTKRRPGT